MTFAEWASNAMADVRTHGPRHGTALAAQEFAVGIGRRAGQHVNYGTPMWERDWDVLVLLDACRHDLMEEAARDRHRLPDDVPAVYSPASMSREWLERHTGDAYADEMAETALVSANAFTRAECVQADEWAALDEVWKHSWSDEHGTVPPRPVTESAIRHWRQRDGSGAERMIVWYLQPHAPFLDAEWSGGFEKDEIGEGQSGHKSVWRRLRDGEVGREEVWRAYRANLNRALDDVDLLLENLESDNVAISSDHANCLGEWGVYGHPGHVPVPSLKRVPWIETTGQDEQTLDPGGPKAAEVSDAEVEDRLEALGYV